LICLNQQKGRLKPKIQVFRRPLPFQSIGF